jgi:hypothetical protein
LWLRSEFELQRQDHEFIESFAKSLKMSDESLKLELCANSTMRPCKRARIGQNSRTWLWTCRTWFRLRSCWIRKVGPLNTHPTTQSASPIQSELLSKLFVRMNLMVRTDSYCAR